MTRPHAWPLLAAAAGVALAAAASSAWAQPAPAQKPQLERGSAIGTPLPVAKVEAAPLPPPPYSDAEKAALAKLDAAASALDGMRERLARQSDALGDLARLLVCLVALQLVVLAVQLWMLRRRRPPASGAAEAAPCGSDAKPS